MVATLGGQFGRYVGQFTAAIKSPLTTIEELTGAGAQEHEAATQAGSTLVTAAASVDSAGMSTAAQALVTAVQTADPDPHEAVQSLAALQADTAAQVRATDALTAANVSVTAMLRRAAVIALANSTTGYALTSYEDAQQLRTRVCEALDAEIVIAADSGDDATFLALSALETAVVQDLTTRGESLATMQDITLGASLPVIVLAQRLYQDVTRYDDLLQQIDPVNPAFAPASFRASIS